MSRETWADVARMALFAVCVWFWIGIVIWPTAPTVLLLLTVSWYAWRLGRRRAGKPHASKYDT